MICQVKTNVTKSCSYLRTIFTTGIPFKTHALILSVRVGTSIVAVFNFSSASISITPCLWMLSKNDASRCYRE